ncbi:phytoene desaturase family protein [Cytobacillus oceanisediminis]|uniref:phytoene desaturase family protein n=2 Tax=Aeromicrobium TaxID=2040 RepID=UPI0006F9B168|nr:MULTISPECIES: phytoene desaturase family protein [unclassified Aeromicrobium]KQO36708.1 phytoene dehydrogenase [Aeromicrobium sp. Leaf245]KQP78067.1 phytoene dehydrogenase [Aeromicrobium sp. Leaf289]
MSHVVVVGAGLAGLAAACHLVGDGHRVTVLEREDVPGGRAGRLTREGFTFDTGPTVLTMPDLIDRPLRAAGSSLAERLELSLLDPAYRAFFADGSTLEVRHGHEAMRAEIHRECGSVDAAAFDEFVVWLRKLYLTEMPHFIDRNFDRPTDLLSRPMAAARLLAMGGFTRLGPMIRRRFADERLHRLFSFQAMYAGLAPDDALSLYAVITYMDSIEGVYFPKGGMRAVPQALADAASDAGADFRYGTTVTALVRDSGGRVRGVATGEGTIAADAVVCTIDLPTAYEWLLPELKLPRAVRGIGGRLGGDYSPSCVVWHVGVKGLPQGKAHHNIHFGHEWAGAFEDLMKRGTLMRDPSRLVTIHSLDDDEAAPEGDSTLYVLEPTPNLDVGHIDWKAEREPMKERLMEFLEGAGYPTDVVVDELVTPLDWHEQGMAAGTPFALAHTFAQTGPFRAANVDKRVPGLVFAGSGTVPGVGVPMVLPSGRLAAERVNQLLR